MSVVDERIMASNELPDPADNFLLGQLPKAEYKRIAASLEYVDLDLGQVLYEANHSRKQVYFPTKGIVSIIEMLEEGTSAEIALIGREGMVGITALLGGESQPNRAVVQSTGAAYRIPAPVLCKEFRKGGALMTLLLLYIQILYTQVAQTAVCNRHHNLQQQLCRWLLMSLDCIGADELSMTQELIAGMLGVRREGVTRAARELQRQYVIEYRRGSIRVVDRDRLESLCCECYALIRSETERLFRLQRAVR